MDLYVEQWILPNPIVSRQQLSETGKSPRRIPERSFGQASAGQLEWLIPGWVRMKTCTGVSIDFDYHGSASEETRPTDDRSRSTQKLQPWKWR